MGDRPHRVLWNCAALASWEIKGVLVPCTLSIVWAAGPSEHFELDGVGFVGQLCAEYYGWL